MNLGKPLQSEMSRAAGHWNGSHSCLQLKNQRWSFSVSHSTTISNAYHLLALSLLTSKIRETVSEFLTEPFGQNNKAFKCRSRGDLNCEQRWLVKTMENLLCKCVHYSQFIMAHLGDNSTHDLLCTQPSLLLHSHDKTTEMSFSLKSKKLIKISKVQAYESLAGSIPWPYLIENVGTYNT
jgi:hypothetical protein